MKPYGEIIEHYEQCLEQHGDTHKGVDWPNAEGAAKRYQVMLEVVRGAQTPHTLLDFGCGAAHLKEYMDRQGVQNLDYAGLDASPRFVELSRSKFPDTVFHCQDVLESVAGIPHYDYIVMNGVFTEKRTLSHAAMWDFFTRTLSTAFSLADIGLAFNVMSKQVDWERDDLFHVPLDDLAWFLKRQLSRNFVIRNDYGMYEYTVYVYR